MSASDPSTPTSDQGADMYTSPDVKQRWAIELKVKVMAIAAAAVGAGVEVLNGVEADHSLLGPIPDWAQGLILVLIPPAVTGLAGWQARHTPRDTSSNEG